MAYSNIDELKKKIDETKLVQLTDTGASGAIDTDKVDRAIQEADAMINSFVGEVYFVPMNPVPNVIVDISATLAILYLHRFRSVESAVWKEAELGALKYLGKIAEGEATLEGAIAEPAPSSDSSNSVTFTASERRFSRDLLKDM
ncbi:hypothetical protein MNBD_NITROSPINAE04-1956 [hydrothermal vent metagenome]|uniref:DUF1320 domain-containing protein n=1 Tax=hydrothermal vent metagenome TaxID=652676 RepID=A0A3B1BGX7_9ZZZZ